MNSAAVYCKHEQLIDRTTSFQGYRSFEQAYATMCLTTLGGNMKKQTKRTLLVVGLFIVVVTTLLVIQLMNRPSDIYSPKSLAAVKAAAPSPVHSCFAMDDSKGLVIPEDDRTSIMNEAMSRIIDIPAGTTYNVNFNTYSEVSATGTVIYSGEYGSYNFAASKRSSGWAVLGFEVCNKA
jgi:hypothetical protein